MATAGVNTVEKQLSKVCIIDDDDDPHKIEQNPSKTSTGNGRNDVREDATTVKTPLNKDDDRNQHSYGARPKQRQSSTYAPNQNRREGQRPGNNPAGKSGEQHSSGYTPEENKRERYSSGYTPAEKSGYRNQRGRYSSSDKTSTVSDNNTVDASFLKPKRNTHPPDQDKSTSLPRDEEPGNRVQNNNTKSKAKDYSRPAKQNQRENDIKNNKAQKSKRSNVFIVICDEVTNRNQKIVHDYILNRIGKANNVQFEVDFTETMKAESNGCTLVTVTVESVNAAKRLINGLNLSNKRLNEKVVGFLSKEKALGEKLQMAKKLEEQKVKAVKELVETTERYLIKHEEKLFDKEDQLAEINKRLSRNLNFREFDVLTNEKTAIEDKLKELKLQRKEFCSYILSMKTKIENVFDDEKYDHHLQEIRKALGVECRRLEAALPMYARREDILDTIRHNQVCVILGETGSGKSTQMVQFLHQAGFAG